MSATVSKSRRRRDRGLCGCGNIPEVGKKTCTSCLNARKQARAASHARNLCGACGKDTPEPGKRTCSKCLAWQKQHREARRAAGLCTACGESSGLAYCATCRAKRRTADPYHRKQFEGLCRCGRPTRPNRHNCQVCHETRRSRKHGLTRQESFALLSAQHGRCKLCDCEIDTIRQGEGGGHVDHDHASGRVRGVLCMRCNLTAGVVEKLVRTNTLPNFLKYLGET
jgi:hypothetical protein